MFSGGVCTALGWVAKDLGILEEIADKGIVTKRPRGNQNPIHKNTTNQTVKHKALHQPIKHCPPTHVITSLTKKRINWVQENSSGTRLGNTGRSDRSVQHHHINFLTEIWPVLHEMKVARDAKIWTIQQTIVIGHGQTVKDCMKLAMNTMANAVCVSALPMWFLVDRDIASISVGFFVFLARCTHLPEWLACSIRCVYIGIVACFCFRYHFFVFLWFSTFSSFWRRNFH